jgi:hypothetical protein
VAFPLIKSFEHHLYLMAAGGGKPFGSAANLITIVLMIILAGVVFMLVAVFIKLSRTCNDPYKIASEGDSADVQDTGHSNNNTGTNTNNNTGRTSLGTSVVSHPYPNRGVLSHPRDGGGSRSGSNNDGNNSDEDDGEEGRDEVALPPFHYQPAPALAQPMSDYEAAELGLIGNNNSNSSTNINSREHHNHDNHRQHQHQHHDRGPHIAELLPVAEGGGLEVPALIIPNSKRAGTNAGAGAGTAGGGAGVGGRGQIVTPRADVYTVAVTATVYESDSERSDVAAAGTRRGRGTATDHHQHQHQQHQRQNNNNSNSSASRTTAGASGGHIRVSIPAGGGGGRGDAGRGGGGGGGGGGGEQEEEVLIAQQRVQTMMDFYAEMDDLSV